MKNSNFFLLVILAIAGCTKKSPETLIGKWEMKGFSSRPSFLQRKLASSASNTCMQDAFTVDVLKEQMLELENAFPQGQRVTGTWKHLDLSSLPVPQANFLKEFGNKIGDLKNPDSIDYSNCQDVPCIINKVYGRENYVAGYVHYIWYLRTNTYLAANNQIPKGESTPNRITVEGSKEPGEYAGKAVSLEKFLYLGPELYGFWRLSNMLRAPHTTLSKLRSIHHIPRGEFFIASEYKKSCGLAFSEGWILLTDGCLPLDANNPDKGYFYEKIMHEMSHHVDFEAGSGTQEGYRSHKKDYLDVVGMSEEEFLNEKNELVRRWRVTDPAKLSSAYALTNPEESFAEDLAMFRVEGDTIRGRIRPEHFNFISQNFYQSRSFDVNPLIDSIIAHNRAETEKAILKVITDCSANSVASASSYLKSSDFSSKISAKDLKCYSSGAEEVSNLLRAKVIMEDPDGCNIIRGNSSKVTWNSSVKELLVNSFSNYINEMRNDPEYVARIQNFYANLDDTTIATNAYLSCYGEADEENCFNVEIKKEAEAQALTLRLPEDLTAEMASLYASHHSYQNIQNKTLKFYQGLVKSNADALLQDSQDLWNTCVSGTIDDSQPPKGKNFQIANGYMVSSVYNCINKSMPDAVKRFVRSINLDGFKIQHPKEEVILVKLAKPEMVKNLKTLYDENREKEKKTAIEYAFDDAGKTRASILSDLSWVRRGYKEAQLVDECSKLTLKQIQFQPLFHLKKDLFKDFISDTCTNLETTSEFKELRGRETLMDQLVDRSEIELTQVAARRAKECLDQYPMGGLLNKVRYRFNREACLKNDWESLENEVVLKMMQDQDVQKLQMKESAFRERLVNSRKNVQKDAISTYFGIF